MTRDAIVHCGFPKTATTTLQKHVFPKISEINYAGKFYDLEDPLGVPIEALLRDRKSCSFVNTNSEVRNVVDALSRALFASDRPLFLSYEEVLGATLRPVGSPTFHGRQFPARSTREQLTFIRDLLQSAGAKTIRVIITLRLQADLLSSYYAEAYRRVFGHISHLNTFGKFVTAFLDETSKAGLYPSALDYCEVDNVCSDVFGEGMTTFLWQPWIHSAPWKFSSGLAEVTRSTPSYIDGLLSSAPRENARRLGDSEFILRTGRKNLSHYANVVRKALPLEFSLGIGGHLHRFLSQFEFGPSDFKPDQKSLRLITEFYRGSNDRFYQRPGRSLD